MNKTAYVLGFIDTKTGHMDYAGIYSEGPRNITHNFKWYPVELFQLHGKDWEDAKALAIDAIKASVAYTWILKYLPTDWDQKGETSGVGMDTGTSTLGIWSDDTEFVIADSAEEARGLTIAYTGITEDDCSPVGDWERRPDTKPFTFVIEDDYKGLCPGSHTKYPPEWVALLGKGWFARVTFSVEDSGQGPTVRVHSSTFGNAVHNLEVFTTKEALGLLGEMFTEASKKFFSKDYCNAATPPSDTVGGGRLKKVLGGPTSEIARTRADTFGEAADYAENEADEGYSEEGQQALRALARVFKYEEKQALQQAGIAPNKPAHN